MPKFIGIARKAESTGVTLMPVLLFIMYRVIFFFFFIHFFKERITLLRGKGPDLWMRPPLLVVAGSSLSLTNDNDCIYDKPH